MREAERALDVEVEQRASLGTGSIGGAPDLRPAFAFMDRRMSGRIKIEDLRATCLDLGHPLSERQAHALLRRLAQSAGVYSVAATEGLRYSDFLAWALPLSPRLRHLKSVLKQAVRDSARTGGGGHNFARVFHRIDSDSTGFISREEFARAISTLLPDLAPRDVGTLVNVFDVGGDGKVDHAEFARLIQRF